MARLLTVTHVPCLPASHAPQDPETKEMVLESGALVALVPDTLLDVPLHWQQARAASSLLDGLTRRILAAAPMALIQK